MQEKILYSVSLENKIFTYALSRLASFSLEDGYQVTRDKDNIYLVFPSGRTLRLSQEEIEHQACEHLRSEIEYIINH